MEKPGNAGLFHIYEKKLQAKELAVYARPAGTPEVLFRAREKIVFRYT